MFSSLLILLSGLAMAQDAEQANPLYSPTIDSLGTWMTQDAGLTDDYGATLKLATAGGQVVTPERDIDFDDGDIERDNDHFLSRNDIIGGVQFDRFRIGADLPIYGLSTDIGDDSVTGGIGDVAIDGRVTVLDRRDTGVGFALQGRGLIPTFSQTDSGYVTGNENGGFETMAIVDGGIGRWNAIANVGFAEYDYSPDAGDDFGDDAFLRLAGTAPVGDRFGATLDLEGRWRFDDERLASDVAEFPLTGLIGGWAQLGEALALRAGGGAEVGIEGDNQEVGTHVRPRFVVDLMWMDSLRTDADGDNVANVVDECPQDAEDIDGYFDADGCPDLDNDGDGLADLRDSCPDIPEDVNGYQDYDGCPDADELAMLQDLRTERTVVTQPVIQVSEITETELVLDEVIYFAFDRADLTPKAQAVLSELAMEIEANPQVDSILIKGHADERGSVPYNLELSRERARSVYNYLVAHGVDNDRLDIIAFGESRPADPGHSPAAWQKNRRVEFEAMDGEMNPRMDIDEVEME